jgi:hypothetical protein
VKCFNTHYKQLAASIPPLAMLDLDQAAMGTRMKFSFPNEGGPPAGRLERRILPMARTTLRGVKKPTSGMWKAYGWGPLLREPGSSMRGFDDGASVRTFWIRASSACVVILLVMVSFKE